MPGGQQVDASSGSSWSVSQRWRKIVAYDEELATRIRAIVGRRSGVSEKKMFGSLAFLVGGNMFCGVVGGDLLVRVGPAAYEATLARPHARQMDFTGRPMKGIVYIAREGIASADDLRAWVGQGLKFGRSLPPKQRGL
jgi:TfoX/Sxy family transcriptional regulator of competence genes